MVVFWKRRGNCIFTSWATQLFSMYIWISWTAKLFSCIFGVGKDTLHVAMTYFCFYWCHLVKGVLGLLVISIVWFLYIVVRNLRKKQMWIRNNVVFPDLKRIVYSRVIFPDWLVVSNMNFIFHIWDVILPIDELHHFSRWAHCTTNQIYTYIYILLSHHIPIIEPLLLVL